MTSAQLCCDPEKDRKLSQFLTAIPRSPFVSKGFGFFLNKSGLLQDPIPQKFGDLYRVQGSPFAQVIGDAPEVQTIVDG